MTTPVPGLPLNYVAVTGTFVDGQGNPASGHVRFQPSDIAWSADLHLVATLVPVGASLDANGAFAVSLLALDNPGFSVPAGAGWVMGGTINGIDLTPRKLTVNFANGATQDITALLANATVA